VDLNPGLDDNDEGKHRSGARGDNRGASRMSPFWLFPTECLTRVAPRMQVIDTTKATKVRALPVGLYVRLHSGG